MSDARANWTPERRTQQAMRSRFTRRWSPAEKQYLLDARSAVPKVMFTAIGKALGRNPTSCATKWHALRRERPPTAQGFIEADRMTIPADVLADRDRRRALAPRDLTALFCGDPLPGASALDRRRE